MLEKLIAFFKKPKEETKNQVPEGICPNCWGYHQYDNKIREAYKDNQIDINNHKLNYDFLSKFKVENLDGIQLIPKKDGSYCPACDAKS